MATAPARIESVLHQIGALSLRLQQIQEQTRHLLHESQSRLVDQQEAENELEQVFAELSIVQNELDNYLRETKDSPDQKLGYLEHLRRRLAELREKLGRLASRSPRSFRGGDAGAALVELEMQFAHLESVAEEQQKGTSEAADRMREVDSHLRSTDETLAATEARLREITTLSIEEQIAILEVNANLTDNLFNFIAWSYVSGYPDPDQQYHLSPSRC